MRRIAKIFPCFIILFFLISECPQFLESSCAALKPEEFEKIVLENGLTLIIQQDETVGLTALQILIRGGKRSDPANKKGLVYLTGRLCLEIPDRSKLQKLMDQASQFFINVRGDYTLITLQCLTRHFESAFDVIIGIIQKPLFSGLRINQLKQIMGYQRKAGEDDPDILASQALIDTIFSSGYCGSIFGTDQSRKTIKKKDILTYYRKYYTGNNIVVVGISDLNKRRFLEMMVPRLENFPSGNSVTLEPVARSTSQDRVQILDKDKEQSHIAVGFPLPAISARNYVHASLLEVLLGKGIDSRLWPLRSRLHLAYTINAQAYLMKDGGVLEAYIETSNSKIKAVKDALVGTLNNLYERGISKEELTVENLNTWSNFLRMMEIRIVRGETVAFFESIGLGFNFYSGFFNELKAVTLQGLNTYLKQVLDPEKRIIAVVGPNTEDKALQVDQ